MRRSALLFLLASALLPAQTKEIQVTPADWVDTGVDLRAGDVVTISASGTLPQGRAVGPAGQSRGFRDLIKAYPVNDGGFGALIGRIGSSDAAVPFLAGENKRLEVPRSGRLFLAINKTANDVVTGAFKASIEFKSR